MKKYVKYLVFVLVASGQHYALSQRIAYYDAMTFAEMYHQGGVIPSANVDVLKILVPEYFAENSVSTNANVFLKNYFADGSITSSPALSDKQSGALKSAEATGALLPVSGWSTLDVSTLSKGVAAFMIKRAKEELTVAFFDKFKKFSEEKPEFKTLFPKTTEALAHLLSYRYPEMLPALRSNFYDDLNALPLHMEDLLYLEKYRPLLQKFPELPLLLQTFRLIQWAATKNSDPATILDAFAGLKAWDALPADKYALKNVGSSLRVLNLFSRGLRSNDGETIWVSQSALQNFIRNPVAFKIFLGLICQLDEKSGHPIYFYQSSTQSIRFREILEKNLADVEPLLQKFILFADKVESARAALQELISNGKDISKENYFDFVESSIDIIELGFDLSRFLHEPVEISHFIGIARDVNDLFKYVATEDYPAAINQLSTVLDTISTMIEKNRPNDKDLIPGLKISTLTFEPSDRVKKILERIEKGGTEKKKLSLSCINLLDQELLHPKKTASPLSPVQQEQLKQLLAIRRFEKARTTFKKLSRYGLFMANMAKAQTPKEVQDLLENAALPVGSSSIKKNSRFNISLQSYLGAYYLPQPAEDQNVSAWNDPFGVHAPIGISFNWGFGKGGCIGAFGSLVDLGAIVDYELKSETDGSGDETITKDYKVELGQIVSPGLYLTYGFPLHWPLALGAGYQYGPGLAKVESNGNTVINAPNWRFNIFLSVDMPLLTLANRSRR